MKLITFAGVKRISKGEENYAARIAKIDRASDRARAVKREIELAQARGIRFAGHVYEKIFFGRRFTASNLYYAGPRPAMDQFKKSIDAIPCLRSEI